MTPTAFITGASSGIGAEFARQLAAKGYNLILTARRLERLLELASTLRQEHSVSVEVISADLSNVGDIQNLAKRISDLPCLELLINNAGFGTKGKYKNVDEKKIESMAHVHLTAPILLSRAALPGMVVHHQGNIINVSSMAGFFPFRSVLYGSSKAFLISFSQSLNIELANSGVHVQALCPGFTITEFHSTPELHTVNFRNLPRFLWLTSEQVVRHSLRDLQRAKEISIPGWQYQLVAPLARNSITNQIIRGLAIRLLNRDRIA